MKKTIFPEGIPIDEKRISFIETIVTRLSRRTKITKLALLTPFPISACVSGDNISGPALKYMFSITGKITTGIVYCNSKPKTGIDLLISINSELSGQASRFLISNKEHEFTIDMQVKPKDRLTISLNPLSNEEGINEVWISITWVPEVKNAVVKQFLIEDLENDISEE